MVQFGGDTVTIFILLTIVFCFAAILTGLALANNWHPAWQALPYGLLLTCGARFLGYALAGGQLLSLAGFVVDAVILVAVILVVHRIVQARKMVSQYPWLYESKGMFGWRKPWRTRSRSCAWPTHGCSR